MYHHNHHQSSAYTPSPSHHRRRSLTPGRVAGEFARAVERDRNFLSPEDALLRRPRALSHSAYSPRPHRHPESVMPLAAHTPTPRHYPSYMARAPHYAPPPQPMAMPPQPAPAVQVVQVPVPVPVPVPAAPHGLHGQFPASMPADVYGQGMGMGYPGAGGRRPMIRRSSSWAHLARDAQRLGREYEYALSHGHGHHHPHAGYGGVGMPFER